MILALGGLGVLLSVAGHGRAASNSIAATVRGLRNDAGAVGCMLYASSVGFPTDPKKATARRFVPISNKAAACVFDSIPVGTYAVIVMHDENGNGRLDRNFLGIPTEGSGASRDARGTFGPPKFDAAAFRFAGGALTVPVSIHY